VEPGNRMLEGQRRLRELLRRTHGKTGGASGPGALPQSEFGKVYSPLTVP